MTVQVGLMLPPPALPVLPQLKAAPKEGKRHAEDLIKRESDLVERLCNATDTASYWFAPGFEFAAPPCGLVPASMYSVHQRVGLLQFTLFNFILSENRNRYFPRRTPENNLWFDTGEVPGYRHSNVVFPHFAAFAQVFDLVPITALHVQQLAARCQRPESAITAAAANRARRDAELLKETTRAIATKPLPSLLNTYTSALPIPIPGQDVDLEEFYLANPRRFDNHGDPVRLGMQSKADNPAPGSHRSVSTSSPNLSHSSFSSRSTGSYASLAETGGFGGKESSSVLLDLANLLRYPSKGETKDDWICACGTHNFNGTHCAHSNCRLPREPTVQSRSALGDPGDWYCDYCGLCNWTRRAYCLRCCPLHPDNIEEAITKGLVHFDDPIIGILGYSDKRARALKKGRSPGGHCACFGPHHGTRCPNIGRAVPDSLWVLYAESQEAIRAIMPVIAAPQRTAGTTRTVPGSAPLVSTATNYLGNHRGQSPANARGRRGRR